MHEDGIVSAWLNLIQENSNWNLSEVESNYNSAGTGGEVINWILRWNSTEKWSVRFCDFLLIFSYFKGLEKGVKSCYEQNRKEGSFSRQFGTQILKNIDFQISVEFHWNSKTPSFFIYHSIIEMWPKMSYRKSKFKRRFLLEKSKACFITRVVG